MDINNFIRRARTSRTSAQMCEIMEIELARVRSELKKPKIDDLTLLIAKMTCAHLWGFNISWGYAHICTLCSVAKMHAEKRVAYLALTLSYAESPQLFSLATNALTKDLVEDNVSTHYKVSLALNTICAICSKETAPAFSSQVYSLVSSGSSIYLRKKAIMAACAILQVCPDLSSRFVDVCSASLSDKAHSVVLAGCELGILILQANEGAIHILARKVYHLLKVLNKLCAVTTFPDHNVGGFCDPLLQQSILRFLGCAISVAFNQNSKTFITALPSLRRYFLSVFNSVLEKCSSTTVSRTIGLSVCTQVFTLFSEIPDQFFFDTTNNPSEVIPEEEALAELVMKFMKVLLEAVTDYSDLISCTALEALINFVRSKKQTAGLDSDAKFKKFSQLLKRKNPAVRKRALDLLLLLIHNKDIKTYIADLFAYIDKKSTDKINKIDFANSIRDIVLLSMLSPQDGFDYLLRLILLIEEGCNNALTHAIITTISRSDTTLADKKHFINTFAMHNETMVESVRNGTVTALVDTYLLSIAYFIQLETNSGNNNSANDSDSVLSSIDFDHAFKLCQYIFCMPNTADCTTFKMTAARALVFLAELGESMKTKVIEYFDYIMQAASPLILMTLLQFKHILFNPSLRYILAAVPILTFTPPNIKSTRRYTNPALFTKIKHSIEPSKSSIEKANETEITLSTIEHNLDAIVKIDHAGQASRRSYQRAESSTIAPVFVNDDLKVYVVKVAKNSNDTTDNRISIDGDTCNSDTTSIRLKLSLYAVASILTARIQYSVPKTHRIYLNDPSGDVTGPLKQPIIQILDIISSTDKEGSNKSHSTSQLSESDTADLVTPVRPCDSTTGSHLEVTDLISPRSKTNAIHLWIRVKYITSHSVKQGIEFKVII